MRSIKCGLLVAAIQFLSLAAASTAGAAGACGGNYTPQTACPVSSPYTTTGTIEAGYSQGRDLDYYVFYAQQDTTYRITLTWTGEPSCQASGGCGWVQEYLYDGAMNIVDKAGVSDIANNQVNPVTMTGAPGQPLAAGTYFIEVSGTLGCCDVSGNFTSVGYRLDVNATPNVVWPPTPTATVPASPTGLLAHGRNPSTVRLQWHDNADTETGFEVSDGTASRTAAPVHGHGPAGFDWTGLAPRTRACFRVRATGSAGPSPWSEERCATTPSVAGSATSQMRGLVADLRALRDKLRGHSRKWVEAHKRAWQPTQQRLTELKELLADWGQTAGNAIRKFVIRHDPATPPRTLRPPAATTTRKPRTKGCPHDAFSDTLRAIGKGTDNKQAYDSWARLWEFYFEGGFQGKCTPIGPE